MIWMPHKCSNTLPPLLYALRTFVSECQLMYCRHIVCTMNELWEFAPTNHNPQMNKNRHLWHKSDRNRWGWLRGSLAWLYTTTISFVRLRLTRSERIHCFASLPMISSKCSCYFPWRHSALAFSFVSFGNCKPAWLVEWWFLRLQTCQQRPQNDNVQKWILYILAIVLFGSWLEIVWVGLRSVELSSSVDRISTRARRIPVCKIWGRLSLCLQWLDSETILLSIFKMENLITGE